jgi:diguanylate cyclase (GGDEF)-like protein
MPKADRAPFGLNDHTMARAEAGGRRYRRLRARWASSDPVVAKLVREIEALSEEVRVLARLARTDPLTGLANRRGWDEQLARELARAQRSGEELSVALLDLDNFKAFNDAHGHQAGDRLLLEAAASWNGQLREVDILCRWGGDEFAVLLPACPRAQADEVIARLRAATPRQQSCAAGVASWDGRETPEGLLGRADNALFYAKAVHQPSMIRAPGRSSQKQPFSCVQPRIAELLGAGASSPKPSPPAGPLVIADRANGVWAVNLGCRGFHVLCSARNGDTEEVRRCSGSPHGLPL